MAGVELICQRRAPRSATPCCCLGISIFSGSGDGRMITAECLVAAREPKLRRLVVTYKLTANSGRFHGCAGQTRRERRYVTHGSSCLIIQWTF